MENKIVEAMSCLDSQLVQEASQSALVKRRWPRTVMLAACLAVLCALSVAAKVYTDWQIGEVTRFDAQSHLEKIGWKASWPSDGFWERDGKYEILPQVEHEAYPFGEVVMEYLSGWGSKEPLYFDSIAEMNAELQLDALDSLILKQRPGERMRVTGAHWDAMPDKSYLLCSQTLAIEGYEKIYCVAAFTVFGFNGATPVFLASIEENNYEFSQIEIENLQVTAELIECEEAGIHSATVCFTKDSIVYYYLFSCKGELDMAAVTAVLETLE